MWAGVLSLAVSVLVTAGCVIPLHRGTLLQRRVVYSHVWPLSSHGCLRVDWNRTRIKLNSSLLGIKDSGLNTSLCFPLCFSVSKLTLLNLLGILELYLIKISFATHIYQPSVSHAFTICGICSVFAISSIWRVQNCVHLLSCPVDSIIAIYFCMVLLSLTSHHFIGCQSSSSGKHLPNQTQHYQPDLLTWQPTREELEKAPPKASVYKVDYRGIPFQPIQQQIVKWPKTSFDDKQGLTTSYRYAHGRDNPNRITLNAE